MQTSLQTLYHMFADVSSPGAGSSGQPCRSGVAAAELAQVPGTLATPATYRG